MGTLFDSGIFSVVGLGGNVMPGSQLYWYEAGTSTPLNTYSDPDLTVPNTNPVLAQGDGRFPSIWLQPESYKYVLTDPDGVVLHTQDDLSSSGSPDAANALGYKYPGPGSQAWSVGGKLDGFISVLDFIPKSLHAAIRAGTDPTDHTAYFQNAAAAAYASATAPTFDAAIGSVYVPNGLYYVRKVGIRQVVFRGEGHAGTRINAATSGGDGEFMFDAMLDTDGVTTNTVGGGWCENMIIDGRLRNGTVSGRSGLRTYGGGANPRLLRFERCAIGLAAGLPIWYVATNILAKQCNVGFYTFHNDPGENGTSATFIGCWADSCTTYGFHITQLYYSSFINCVAQLCGTHNFYLEGDGNGNTACYSLQFLGCATEGSGTPFYMKRGRDITILNPRIIQPTNAVDYIVMDDCAGSIRDFSTVSSPGAGKYHVLTTNGTPYSILLDNSFVTYAYRNPGTGVVTPASDPTVEGIFARSAAGSGGATASGASGSSFYVAGRKVLGNQGVAVSDIDTTGVTGVDLTIANTVNALLARLRQSTGHGIIAG